MALIRLAYAADLPGPEAALKRLQAGDAAPAGGGGAPSGPSGPGGSGGAVASGGGVTSAVARSVAQAQPQASGEPVAVLHTFDEMLALIEKKRDIALKLDVERFVRPISFRPGAIEYEPAPGAPATTSAQRLVARLKDWTGERWLIAAQGGGGAESLWERQKREEREVRAQVNRTPSCWR